MQGFHAQMPSVTGANESFRKVLYTGEYAQLVAMTLPVGGDIGMEVHDDGDQYFRIESGEGEVVIDDTTYSVAEGDVLFVPAGAQHNVTNTGPDALRLYTMYSPPHHQEGTERATKQEALADEPHFDGTTTE